MITEEKCFDLYTNSLNQFFKKCMEASVENFHVDLGTILLLLVFKSPVGTLVVVL